MCVCVYERERDKKRERESRRVREKEKNRKRARKREKRKHGFSAVFASTLNGKEYDLSCSRLEEKIQRPSSLKMFSLGKCY